VESFKFEISNVKGLINDLNGVGTPDNPADAVIPSEITEKATDGKGNVWTYQTNKFASRKMSLDPLGNMVTYDRDIHSNLKKLTRANGSTVEMKYDGKGNLVSVLENTNAALTKIKYEKNFNQPISITNPMGNTTMIDYDSHGNPINITDAQGNVSRLEYNPKGQVTKVVSAFGTSLQNQTSFAYDVNTHNLTTVIDPLNRATFLTYDSAGNILTITDANGKISRFTYDPMNRVKTAVDANGKVTSYTYDNNSNLTSVTDANNHATTFAYDEQNQLVRTTNPLNEH
jgi:YD repeat-containing protein